VEARFAAGEAAEGDDLGGDDRAGRDVDTRRLAVDEPPGG
jgi:hypothetical protein